jgi:HSP20 family protein
MRLDDIRHSLGSLRDNVAGGWRHLLHSASTALTRFKPGERTNLPSVRSVSDDSFLPSVGWAVLGGDVFESDDRLLVRLEVPGLDKKDLHIDVGDDAIVVSGEKRFEQEATEGRWHVVQCAYGSFSRSIPLPVPVKPGAAKASYKDGILRIDLPKATPGRRSSVAIAVE